jgi:hypothetical protein
VLIKNMNMVMQAWLGKVIQRPRVKLIDRPSQRVHFEIVLLKDFGQVGQIIFTNVHFKISEHMVDGGRTPAVIESLPVIGKDQDQGAVRFQHPASFFECFDGIGKVFQIVRREENAISLVLYIFWHRSFTEQFRSGSFSGTEEKTLRAAGPHRGMGKVAIIQNEKETARFMRRLVAAGSSTGVIYKILRQWNVPEEALAALENLGEASTKSRGCRNDEARAKLRLNPSGK